MADMEVSSAMGAVGDLTGMAAANPGNVCGNSMEQIFSPVEIMSGEGGSGSSPAFGAVRSAYSTDGQYSGGHLGPTRAELDPYFSNLLNDEWIAKCDYAIMRNNGSASIGGGEDINIRKTADRKNITGVMATALRGPLILSGWGCDIADRPVPGGLEGLDEEVPGNRSSWKSGPVDLKWDDERKVWSGGAQIVCGVVSGRITAPTDPCNPTYFMMKVFRLAGTAVGSPFDAPLDACLLSETVRVTNRDSSLTEHESFGRTFCVCVRINYEWIPIWVGCPDQTATTTEPSCVRCSASPSPETEEEEAESP